MTFDIESGAEEETAHRAQQFHEFAVNELNIPTAQVLFTAKADGTVDGTIVSTEEGEAR